MLQHAQMAACAEGDDKPGRLVGGCRELEYGDFDPSVPTLAAIPKGPL